MPIYNLNLMVTQIRHAMEKDNKGEAEAMADVLKANGIDEKEATENGLQAELSRLLNQSSEQQKEQAEKELAAQSEEGNKSVILKDQGGSENEATLQEEQPDYAPKNEVQ